MSRKKRKQETLVVGEDEEGMVGDALDSATDCGDEVSTQNLAADVEMLNTEI